MYRKNDKIMLFNIFRVIRLNLLSMRGWGIRIVTFGGKIGLHLKGWRHRIGLSVILTDGE
jgi:hypothetical protein